MCRRVRVVRVVVAGVAVVLVERIGDIISIHDGMDGEMVERDFGHITTHARVVRRFPFSCSVAAAVVMLLLLWLSV